ncbi:hypothetical protein CDL12_08122 [Handroanthus impetiginosus]|uniref:Ionotropic glutamate receptor C-terminal domain-containing protein n=1 Tax=Handroanthus impetiginosus TaxID=429701 RepID=A0A2G9HNU1_9LAMI|nr:hypothetical protein CDL12_08122 [Handroanthus impetiginosus]
MKTVAFFLCVLLLRFPSRFYAYEHKVSLQDNGDKVNVNVGVIVDVGSWVGKVVRSCIATAVSDFYNQNTGYRTRIALHFRDSRGDSLYSITAALELLENVEVHEIIIPKISNEELFLARLADKANHPYFIQLATDENIRFSGISAFLQAFKWRRFVFLYEDTADARQTQTYVHDILQENHLDVAYETALSLRSADDQIINELRQVLMIEVSIILVHLSPSLASQVFIRVNLGMMSKGFGWIVTSKTMNFLDSLDSSVYESMQRVIGFKSNVSESSKIQNLTLSWRREFHQGEPDVEIRELNSFGMKHSENWAEGAGLNLLGFGRLKVSNISSAILSKITSSQFREFGGQFQLQDIYEILNVIGRRERRVGFWNSAYGLTKELVNLYHDQQNNKTTFGGFCIDVFQASVDRLRYEISFKYIFFYNHYGSYSNLVYQVYLENYDAAVGDTTILSNRSKFVDFTLPYTCVRPGCLLRFAASTLVYAHRERLQSNVSKFVVSAWFSLLTIEWIKLSKSGYIGYPANSLIRASNVSNLNFKDNRLKPFQQGRKKGGVDAIVDELPYLKIFVAMYPHDYAMIESSMITGGFGFAFPRGSLLKWFSSQLSPLPEDNEPPSNPDTLSNDKFFGLFILSGISKSIAILILLIFLLHEKLSINYYMITVLARGKLILILRYFYPRMVNIIDEEDAR